MSQSTTETDQPKLEPHKPKPFEVPAGAKRNRRLTTWVVLVVVILGLGAIAYRARMNSGGTTASGRRRWAPGSVGAPPPPVVVMVAEKADMNVILNGLGTITPLATVTIRTQINGELVRVNFTEGQMVNKGDVLAVIDPRPYDAALKQAQGQLEQAQAQLKESQIDLERYVTLSAQDSISKQQVDAQRALVSQYEGMSRTDQGIVDNAQLNLIYCNITAPVSGRVGLRLVDQGNYVTPGDPTGLVILTQIKPITAIFTLPEDDIPALQARQARVDDEGNHEPLRVTAYNRTHTKRLATGVLSNVDNMVDTTTGTLKLRATFANEDQALFPNQFVNIGMLLDVDKAATVIPTSAIERGQQGSFVYLVDTSKDASPNSAYPGAASTGTAHPGAAWSGATSPGAASATPPQLGVVSARTVTLGDTEGERVVVLKGVSPGDKVVVDGADRLKDGMTVVVQVPGAAAASPTPHRSGGHRPWTPGGSP